MGVDPGTGKNLTGGARSASEGTIVTTVLITVTLQVTLSDSELSKSTTTDSLNSWRYTIHHILENTSETTVSSR